MNRPIHQLIPRFALIACLALLALPGILGSAARKPFSQWDRQANELLSKMTVEEKVGQMLQPDQANLKDPGDIRKYNLGSLLSGGDSDPKGGNSMQEWTALYERFQAEALKSRLRIPLLYGVDAVHGHSNVLGAVIFPHNVGLGATRNASLVEKVGRITALEMRATGIHWTFAPCVTVPRDERWGRTYEGFGETPELARDLGAAATRGLQGNNLADPLSVLACAKHFVADGGTVYGTGPLRRGSSGEKWPLDRGDVRLDEKTLKAIHMQGYISSIKAGVAARDRGPGSGGRTLRRPQAHGEAAFFLATIEQPASDQRRRLAVRPSLQVRIRHELLSRAAMIRARHSCHLRPAAARN